MTQDNTIVPFKPKIVTSEVTPNETIVALLEFYLAKAKEGDIKFVAIAAVDVRGDGHSSWNPPDMTSAEITTAMGAVGYLSHRFNSSALDGDVYTEDQP